MNTFSVCICARDGGQLLTETLQSISGLVAEVIVLVPDGNTTVLETAKRYASLVFPYAKPDGICAALQSAFAKAKGDYLFWLDEGDQVERENRSKLRMLRYALHPDVAAVCIKHAFPSGGPDTAAYYRFEVRMAARSATYTFQDDANPVLIADGKTAVFDLCVTHRQTVPENYASGLSVYRTELRETGALFPRERLFLARALRDSGCAPEAISQYESLLLYGEAPKALRLAACLELAVCQTGREKRMETLLQSFRFSRPQADICCMMGTCLRENSPREAIYWYELALSQKLPISSRNIYFDYWGYIPALELCRSYYALGETEKAVSFNRIAGECKPGDASVRYNNAFFTGLQCKSRD